MYEYQAITPPRFRYRKTKHGGCAPVPALTPGAKAETMHVAHFGSQSLRRHRRALHADK